MKASLTTMGQQKMVSNAMKYCMENIPNNTYNKNDISNDILELPQFTSFLEKYLIRLEADVMSMIRNRSISCNDPNIPREVRSRDGFYERCLQTQQQMENDMGTQAKSINWYKKSSFNKRASVDFFLSGVDKISKPMTVLDICNEMLKYGSYTGKNFNEGQGIHIETISPDGNDSFNWTGTINIYVPDSRSGDDGWQDIPEEERLKEDQVKDLVKGYNSYKQGIVLGYPTKDVSNMTGGNVYRIQVIRNETKDLEQIPTLNVSNMNASAFLKLLKFHGIDVDAEEYSGSFSGEEYIGARQLMSDDTLKQFQRDAESEGNMYQGQLSLGMLRRYMEVLDSMVEWAQRNDIPVQEIMFG